MKRRYVFLFVIVLLPVAAILLARTPKKSHQPGERGSDVMLAAPKEEPTPRNAQQALDRGRYFLASRLLHEYLTSSDDSSAATLLNTARADAGWENWRTVRSLLQGRRWLEREQNGAGLELLARAEMKLGNDRAADSAFSLYLSAAKTMSARQRGSAQLRRAVVRSRYDERGSYEGFEQAAKTLPDIAQYIRVWELQAAARGGDTSGIRAIAARMDPASASQYVWRATVDALVKANAPLEAANVAMRSAPTQTGSRRADALATAGSLFLQAGDTARATDALRRAVVETGSPAAARQLIQLDTSTAVLQRSALVLVRAGDTLRGAPAVRTLIRRGAASNDVRAELARLYFRRGGYSQTIELLEPLLRDTASTTTQADLLYLLGRSHYRNGDGSRAQTTFSTLASRFPTSAAAGDALFFLGDLQQDAGATDSATALFKRVIAGAPKSERAGNARMRLGVMALAAKRNDEAARIFDDYRPNASGTYLAQANYWAGRAYTALGRDSLARARWRDAMRAEPLSFYAGRAGERLNVAPLPALQASPHAVPLPHDASARIDRIVLLRDLGFDDAVRTEIGHLGSAYRTQPGATYAIAEALISRGFANDAIALGRELQKSSALNSRLLRILYPLPYRAVLTDIADRRDLGLDLVAGLTRQESGFNPEAVSAAGAVGLMQVMPGTGRELGRGVGVQRFDTRMLEIPEVNVELGAAFLADLMKQNDDRLPLVLAAYNAGPNRLEKWRSFPEYADDELFMERIPFEETRDYVRIVSQNARVYRAVYGLRKTGASNS